MKNLYNEDGSLCLEAQLLLPSKPDNMSTAEWRTVIKEFKSQLSEEDTKEFNRLKSNKLNSKLNAKRSAAWRKKNPEKVKENSAKWHTENSEKKKEYNSQWRSLNRDHRRTHNNDYARTRRKNDPLYRFFCNIRGQTLRVVKQLALGKNPTNTFKWVGCSPEQLKAHIESLFLEGMTWDNHGKYGWHIDHIRPVCSFSAEEWKQINHYTNLQPLWAEDNLKKGDDW